MYLHHELREVAADRQSEALDRISTLHHLMQQSPGFLRSLACRYMGNMTQYAWLRTWDSSAAHVAFRHTRPAADFGATRPEGLYWLLATGIAPDGHWQSVLESGKPDDGGSFLLRVAFSVPKEGADAFLKARSLHDEIALAVPRVASLVTFESEADSDARTYLSLIRTNDLSAYRGFLESKQGAAALDPDGSQCLVVECYEIVEELEGSRS